VLNVTGIDLYETNATVAANITKGVLPRAHFCPFTPERGVCVA
jgi:hypothetical protein